MQAEDLMAAVFPDAAACLENIPGDRQVPDHPLVKQTVRDCLEEAMDIEGLTRILTALHAGQLHCVSRDTPEPSAFCHEILNARPYAFLDDAPLEERRTQAVQTRRVGAAPDGERGTLDAAAIARVRDEVRPDPRDADELHDVLQTAGFLCRAEVASDPSMPALAAECASRGVATLAQVNDVGLWIAAERLPELNAVHPGAALTPPITPPASRAARSWTRVDALAELLRGRMALLGPVTAGHLAASLAIAEADVNDALLVLEADGAILRGTFTASARDPEWCDRRLLARMHRYTLQRLRAEIAPVTVADFTRFLFDWQHVSVGRVLSAVSVGRVLSDPPGSATGALTSVEGLRAVMTQLDGLELPGRAWEQAVLPARVRDYSPAMLDMLCLTGEVGWARLSSGPTQVVGATPIALFLREHAEQWLELRNRPDARRAGPFGPAVPSFGPAAHNVLDYLRARGASFAHDIASGAGLSDAELREALHELVSEGLVSSDGFAGLRAITTRAPEPVGRHRASAPSPLKQAGRWFLVDPTDTGLQPSNGSPARVDRHAAVDTLARALLRRYGVVFRRLLAREATDVPWRELARTYRRLEARGDIRGGRFVTGVSGEQFALPDAVDRLREIRRSRPDDTLITISAADPLNLVGILTDGERIRLSTSGRIVYHQGVAIAALEGDMLRALAPVDGDIAEAAAAAAAGRRVPVLSGWVGRV
jgi:ATP-dependent Lhr-like helicase